MKLLPINNINNQSTQFKAKFRKQDINEFLREIENNDVDIVPKLYTMLDIIKKQKGKNAEIEHRGLWQRILIDGKSVNNLDRYFSAFHALQDATIKLKNIVIRDPSVKRLSEEEFENAYYKNSKKTKQDIENMFKGKNWI